MTHPPTPHSLAQLHETLVAVKVLLVYEEAQQAAERNALHTITDPIAASLQQVCCLPGCSVGWKHPTDPACFAAAASCKCPACLTSTQLLQECGLMATLRHPNIVQARLRCHWAFIPLFAAVRPDKHCMVTLVCNHLICAVYGRQHLPTSHGHR